MKKAPIKVVRELSRLNLTHDKMLLVCTSVGNPDRGQYSPVSDNQYVIVENFEEASAASRAYISFWGLGGGNWSGGQLYSGAGHHIANVSYNGRVWKAGKDFVNSAELEVNADTVAKYAAFYKGLYDAMVLEAD